MKFAFWLLNFESSLYSLDTLSDVWYTNIFSHSIARLLTLLTGPFTEQKLEFWRSLVYPLFLLWIVVFGVKSKNYLPSPRSQRFSPDFLSVLCSHLDLPSIENQFFRVLTLVTTWRFSPYCAEERTVVEPADSVSGALLDEPLLQFCVPVSDALCRLRCQWPRGLCKEAALTACLCWVHKVTKWSVFRLSGFRVEKWLSRGLCSYFDRSICQTTTTLLCFQFRQTADTFIQTIFKR